MRLKFCNNPKLTVVSSNGYLKANGVLKVHRYLEFLMDLKELEEERISYQRCKLLLEIQIAVMKKVRKN